MAEGDARKTVVDISLHDGIEVGSTSESVGSGEILVKVVFVVIAGEVVDFGFDEVFAFVKNSKESGRNNQ